LYWTVYLVLAWMQAGMFGRFMAILAGCAVLVLGFGGWWLLNRRIRLADRLLAIGVALLAGTLTGLLVAAPDERFPWALTAIPWLFTAWTAWLLVARWVPLRAQRFGLVAVLLLVWVPFALLRFKGLRGEGEPEVRWIWTPTAESLYLAGRGRDSQPAADPPPASLHLQPGDWPGFRGPDRDGAVHGVRIATDWEANPPRPVWRQRIGPAWSSVAVVDGRLFTQEQRSDSEAVVCLDAAGGKEIWSHLDAGRWSDGQAGPGPRATPTFADGRIYALGAKGILNCLDAATGQVNWSHNIMEDAGAKALPWGFASSPLVSGGKVIVFAGGDGDKGLLAYEASSGDLAWTAAAGQFSYASPQPASLGGEEQVLFLDERGLSALDAVSGRVLWEHASKGRTGWGLMRCTQPQPVGKGQVVFASEVDAGTVLIDVAHDGTTWTPTERWASRDLRPSFNDFVVHDGSIYGFDGNIFCCLDLQTGKRRWKEGRYDHGQVLLLADQPLLLVLSESGEAVLVAANPEQHEEMGRFQAVNGKTWNHPVIAEGRLYVRNAEEIACYPLAPAAGR
jgi:outer membrane protein assembly factor BamB